MTFGSSVLAAKEPPGRVSTMVQDRCLECHDSETKKGDFDLSALSFDLGDPAAFGQWVKVHDRVRDGEMPPPKKKDKLPSDWERSRFLKALAGPLEDADEAREKREGRSTARRMNRFEYENTLRDLFAAPWLQVANILPEDGVAYRYNKVSDALDVSHVQMARYLAAAEYAMREVIQAHAKPEASVKRYYAREQNTYTGKVIFTQFNRSPERATFPIVGIRADLPALEEGGPMTVGEKDPVVREIEAMGVVASSYEPIEPRFNKFQAPAAGRYKLRFSGFSFWAGPENEKNWWRPSRTDISAGRTIEPVSIYSETPPRQLRKLGGFDLTPEPSVQEIEVYLLKGESVRPDPVRLFRSRPPNFRNPLAQKDGQPGVAFRWLEVEGPLPDAGEAEAFALLYGDLPAVIKGADVVVTPQSPAADAERLLRTFMAAGYRRPVEDAEVVRFLGVVNSALGSGSSFADAMIAGYSAVLCSPAFVTIQEKPGALDDYAIASRLSYFLWNSAPDPVLRQLAQTGKLHRDSIIQEQARRLLDDDRSSRFMNAFLDYWLDLRKNQATSPDAELYPDYYLDDFLVESATAETRAFFTALVREDLPARNIVASDFVMLNERLAAHYGLPPVKGVEMQKVSLPAGSVRGGLLTQASVLKVTANGTTTSPVLRGAWIMERILGQPVPPPPKSVPAIEPDTRGATTIRQQLEKHRSQTSCNSCHAKMDPAGFALESFDVVGGWRTHYRATGNPPKVTENSPRGKNGQPFAFADGQPVDSSGELPDGRKFTDIGELKQLLLANERQIARNLVQQLVVYATGAPVSFGDRPEVEQILDEAKSRQYGVRTLILAIIDSDLFRNK